MLRRILSLPSGRSSLVSAPAWVLATVVALVPAPVAAQQTFEVIGSRALGMGGAFVAVADDPTAVFWNPAGLASGPPGGVTIEWVRFRSGDRQGLPSTGSWQRSAKFMSLGTWPIGLSYSDFDETELVGDGAGSTVTRRFSTRHYSATVLQTLTPGLVVGTTLKYVRGTVATGAVTAPTTGEALETGAGLEGRSSGVFDLDASLMFDARVFRVGWTVRNLRSPEFAGSAGTAITLKRRSRVGLAVLPADGLTLAIDLDLDTVDLPGGPSRMLAAGGEHRLTPRVVVRGGLRWNLEGERAAVGSVGASWGLRPGAWLDGHVTQGGAHGERGLGLALRAGW
ncbi:MAG: conjugal transfer protein TraF [Acidobacteria bacterium]|nr:conjugal transfer protein TraF [Acidobacteriota bacterium]